ncbi:MAG: Rrf2 family transcriptional regulator [Vampirovibrionia bacterium]
MSILKISDAAAIAMHTVVILNSTPDKQYSNKELTTILNVSENHLSKIMQRLNKAQIVTSIRGPKGGFIINPEASDRSLLEVYEAIEGQLTISNCLLKKSFCSSGCLLGDFLISINQQFKDYFIETKISDLTNKLKNN